MWFSRSLQLREPVYGWLWTQTGLGSNLHPEERVRCAGYWESRAEHYVYIKCTYTYTTVVLHIGGCDECVQFLLRTFLLDFAEFHMSKADHVRVLISRETFDPSAQLSEGSHGNKIDLARWPCELWTLTKRSSKPVHWIGLAGIGLGKWMWTGS